MSDELNPYPGNLKQHKVDLLMPDDPYLTELIKALKPMEPEMDTAKQFLLLAGERDALLAARAKDAELIQRLVDAISYSRKHGPHPTIWNCHWDIALHNALSEAADAGFKPTNP